jgi:hypothetical protein
MNDQPASATTPRWCLVGNIVQKRPFGEGGLIVKQGTKHFPPGAKVYCLPVRWGDGYEQIVVIGRHRGSHRYCTMIVSCHHITNWRPQLVYSPEVHRLMDESVSQPNEIAHWISREQIDAWLPGLIAREQAWNAKHPISDDDTLNP